MFYLKIENDFYYISDIQHFLGIGAFTYEDIFDGGLVNRQLIVQHQDDALPVVGLLDVKIEVPFFSILVRTYFQEVAHGLFIDFETAVRRSYGLQNFAG